MKKISSSASRITLLLLTATLCAGLFTGQTSVDFFQDVCLIVFTYYFVSVGTK